MELTPLEQKLLYLKENHDRLFILAKNLPLLKEEEGYDFRSVIREYAIVILRNFITIKESFDKEPTMKDKRALHSCLEPFWKPIISRKEDIQGIRNKRYAHAADGVKHEEPISEFLVRSTLPGSYGDLLFLMICACGYAQYMLAHFRSELEKAVRKEGSNPDAEMPHELSYKDARIKAKELGNQVVECLRKNNLVSES